MIHDKEIKKLIDSFYEIISGKAGQARDWERFKLLFFDNARLIPHKFDQDKNCITIPHDINSYITRLKGFLEKNDFYEYGYKYRIEQYHNIAQVYSTYEAKTSPNASKLLKKGTNLVQLINNGIEWKIINMLWQDDFLIFSD